MTSARDSVSPPEDPGSAPCFLPQDDGETYYSVWGHWARSFRKEAEMERLERTMATMRAIAAARRAAAALAQPNN